MAPLCTRVDLTRYFNQSQLISYGKWTRHVIFKCGLAASCDWRSSSIAELRKDCSFLVSLAEGEIPRPLFSSPKLLSDSQIRAWQFSECLLENTPVSSHIIFFNLLFLQNRVVKCFNLELFTATLRVLRHVVGLSTHAVCVAQFTSNAYDVHVTAELLWRPTQVCAASWGMGKISMRSPRHATRVSFANL